MGEYAFVPMAYGASLHYKGLAKHPSGKEENQFEVKVPTLDFGVFKFEPVATVFVTHGPSSIIVEGDKVELRGAPEEMSSAVQNARFNLKVTAGFNDKHEITAKGDIFLAMNGEGAVLPKDSFESVGNGAMGMALSTLMKGFCDSFADDYKKWSTDADL